MSQTLGEKLRQAREDKGLSLGDVAEQTRISSLYLEAIENDDYKILPGGIFNKGFVKSYAKFVGINEQEALMDYQAVLARSEGAQADSDPKVYKPEVLTDDRSGSMLPTILVAALVLALMTGGILYLVSYLRSPSSTIASNTAKPSNVSNESPASTPESGPTGVPDMASLKVEVKATSDVSLNASVDGAKATTTLVHAGSSQTFEPKQSLKLSYSRSLASAVQLAINGKTIAPPATPLDPKRSIIEFEINKDNLAQIWNGGSIVATPAETNTNTNTTAAGAPTPKATPKPLANTNTATGSNSAVTKPPVQSKPTPKPTIITVGTPKKTGE
jgi:cytoskeleton protein RodZ